MKLDKQTIPAQVNSELTVFNSIRDFNPGAPILNYIGNVPVMTENIFIGDDKNIIDNKPDQYEVDASTIEKYSGYPYFSIALITAIIIVSLIFKLKFA